MAGLNSLEINILDDIKLDADSEQSRYGIFVEILPRRPEVGVSLVKSVGISHQIGEQWATGVDDSNPHQ